MKTSLTLAAMVCAIAAALPAFGQAAPPDSPPPAASAALTDAAPHTLAGTVQNYNYGPRGMVEGLIVTVDGKTTQINLPREAEGFAGLVAVGDQIKVTVTADDGPPGPPTGRGPGARGGRDARAAHGGTARRAGGPDAAEGTRPPRPMNAGTPDHPVYRLISLTDAKGQEHRVSTPADRKAVHVEGTVKSLNYDRRGMPDGAVLDSGDFIRIGPRDAGLFDLSPGKKLTVDGIAESTLTGHQMIEAHTINGISVHPPEGPGPRGPRAGDAGEGGGRMGGPGRGGPGRVGPGGDANEPPANPDDAAK